MLKRLRVQGFKSLADIEFEFPALTVLFGPNALRALLKDEQDRGPDFLRLANALSALYPKDSEEKPLLDAMLLAMPR
ncbi:MAG: hypothetical protein OEW45_09605 [Deltaproteobacteria bacterium]|nr:hypothetical protein [Deltaproteobacteria bacterium]